MNNEQKLEYYRRIRKKVAEDGKSHLSVRTKNGVVIDGKLHKYKREIIPQNNNGKSK